jgi:hypothetical protein
MGYCRLMRNIKELKEGQLCVAMLRRYKGKGRVKLLLHEAKVTPDGGYGYGHGKLWVVSAGTLMGMHRSDKKAKSSKENGKLGGRPAMVGHKRRPYQPGRFMA